MKLRDIKNSVPGLAKLLNADFPIKTAYNIRKMYKALQEEFEHIESIRVKLIKDLGEERAGTWKVKKQNEHEFNRELGKLYEEETDIKFTPIKLEEISNIELSALDLDMLIRAGLIEE